MGINKGQKQAAERSKTTQPAAQPAAVAEQPKVATAPAAVATPSKQQTTIDKLKAAWTERKVDLSKLQVKDDGKFKLLIVDAGWPTVRVGNSGGITVMELRSYANAFDAAVDGLALYQKQNARDQKKVAVAAPAPPAAPAAKQTVTAKKQKADAAVEQQLSA